MGENKPIKDLPRHIGCIIDGNRRFSRRLMQAPEKGHEWGYKKVKELIKWCQEFKVKEITLFTFSIENFNRPKIEFNYLMSLFKKAFKEFLKDKDFRRIKVKFIGRIHMFPKEVQKGMYELMNKTKDNKPFKLNLAMAYGGRAEIIDATKRIAEAVKYNDLDIKEINEKTFKDNLYLDSEPELMIRTSEQRLSGFLTWQSVYSEIIFLPKILWPEFSKEDFIACLEEYSRRQRRFGR